MNHTIKKPKRTLRPREYLVIAILCAVIAVGMLCLSLVGLRDIRISKKTYDDYTEKTFTYLSYRYVKNSDDTDGYFLLTVKESEKPLRIASLFDSADMRNAVKHIPQGALLRAYVEESDTEFRVGELAVGEHLLLTLSEHNRLYYNNGFSCALALSLLSLVILCPCVLCFSLYRKAKAKAAERFARYHCEAIKLPYTPERRHADLKDDVMSKETFVFEISLIIGLFVLFFVLLLVGILLELAMTAVLVAALSSLAISLILLFTQYKALRRYEIVSAVGKLYRSGITKASLSYTRGTLTERLLFCGYLQKSPAVFESTGRAYSEGRTEMNYRALFYTENELHTFAESLKTPSPKQRLATHTLLFVFLDGKEDAALHDTLLVLERSLMNGTYSVTPVLLTPTAVYLPRLTLMQAPSMEAEFLLGLW